MADGLEGWAVRLKLLLWRERAEVKAGLLFFWIDGSGQGERRLARYTNLTDGGPFQFWVSTYCGLRCAVYDMSILVRMT